MDYGESCLVFGVRRDEDNNITVQKADGEVIRRPFVFHSRDHARKFADDALTALEYLNCVVAD